MPDEVYSEEVQEKKRQAQEQRQARINRVSPIILATAKYFPVIPAGLIESIINFFKESRRELSPERLEFIYKDVQKEICSGGSR